MLLVVEEIYVIHQLKYCHKLLCKDGFDDNITFGKIIASTTEPELAYLIKYLLLNCNEYVIVKWINFNVVLY